jgi:hypothetical protein
MQTIQQRALLVSLKLTGLGNSKKDKAITDEVIHKYAAADEAGRFLATRLPRLALDPIRQIDGQIRRYRDEMTVPFFDDGRRALPASRLQDFQARCRRFRSDREDAVDRLVSRWDYWVGQASIVRGRMFRRDDYPDASKVYRAFDMKLDFSPVPTSDDFRFDLDEHQRKDIEDNLRESVERAAAAARADLARRITSPLQRLVKQARSDKPVIHETLVADLHELARIIPELNVTGDPDLESIAGDIERKFGYLDAGHLRESASARSIAGSKAQGIIDKMAAFMGAPQPLDLAVA